MQMRHLEVQVWLSADSTFPVDHRLLLARERPSLEIHLEVVAVIVKQVSAYGISVYELEGGGERNELPRRPSHSAKNSQPSC